MNKTNKCPYTVHYSRNPPLNHQVGCMQNSILPVKRLVNDPLLGINTTHINTMLVIIHITSRQLKHELETSLQ